VLSENYESIKDRVRQAAILADRDPFSIKILAAVKYTTIDRVNILFDEGLAIIGENRLQTAMRWENHPLRRDFSLHMIGHLQTNKAAKACAIFDTIDTVDSTRLAQNLNKVTLRPLPIMVEVNISGERQKSGCFLQEFDQLCDFIINNCKSLVLSGVFTMTPVDAPDVFREHIFDKADGLARQLEDRLSAKIERSYGMSDDYELAVKHGSTMIRLGRALFGGE